MANLKDLVCPIANEVHYKMHQGVARRSEALAIVVRELEAGTASIPLQKIAAKMLSPQTSTSKRGPKKGFPNDWLDISEAYDALRDAGMGAAEARLELAERFGRSTRTVDDALAFAKDTGNIE
ncbi:hypothetical protein VQ045_15300 [Aurantimonas sp. E1-2-R+4]|uniref:hypothetical protein n=1 Tax=Aurantimonas sp. E1-2-R+4 TaxID=3113714 RepID=UPI002F9396F4